MAATTGTTAATSTKAEILGHALDLFGQGGYERTALRDIAERMGFTKAALYYHYRTKDQLLTDLFEPVMQAGDEIVQRHAGLTTPARRRSFLEEYFDHLWHHRVLLCHVACDLAVLTTAGIGGRIVDHVGHVVDALAGASTDEATRVRAKAGLGALQGPITLVEPESDLRVTRQAAVSAALAALSAR